MTRGGWEGSKSGLQAPHRRGQGWIIDIDGVRVALVPVPLEDQRILLNTGGRLAYGYRIAGADGGSLSARVMRRAERTLRRIGTVAQRLDESL